MAKNRLRLREDVENFKLVTIGHYFGIQFEAHSAIEDTRTTGKLVQLFVHEYAEEERTPDVIPKKGRLRPNIRTISFWQGFRGFARIYVNMDVGSIYYDIRSGIGAAKMSRLKASTCLGLKNISSSQSEYLLKTNSQNSKEASPSKPFFQIPSHKRTSVAHTGVLFLHAFYHTKYSIPNQGGSGLVG